MGPHDHAGGFMRGQGRSADAIGRQVYLDLAIAVAENSPAKRAGRCRGKGHVVAPETGDHLALELPECRIERLFHALLRHLGEFALGTGAPALDTPVGGDRRAHRAARPSPRLDSRAAIARRLHDRDAAQDRILDHTNIAVAPLFHGVEFDAQTVDAAGFDFGQGAVGGRDRRQHGAHGQLGAAALQGEPAAGMPGDGALDVMMQVEVNRFGHAERARLKPLAVARADVAVFHDDAGQAAALGSKL